MLILHFQNHAILIGNALFAIFSHILKTFIPLCYFTLDFSSRYTILLRIMNLHCQKYFSKNSLSIYHNWYICQRYLDPCHTFLSTSGCYGSEGILHIALWRISVHWATMTTVIPHFPKCDKTIGSICFYVCKYFCWQSRRIFPWRNGCNDKRYGLL